MKNGTPFKRGDILQFYHGDVEGWACQDGSLLLVTADQVKPKYFTGQYLFTVVGRPTGKPCDSFDEQYFTKVGHAEGLTDE